MQIEAKDDACDQVTIMLKSFDNPLCFTTHHFPTPLRVQPDSPPYSSLLFPTLGLTHGIPIAWQLSLPFPLFHPHSLLWLACVFSIEVFPDSSKKGR